MMFRRYCFLFTSLLLAFGSARAQQRPVGFWRAHLPTNSAQGIATDGKTNYVITGKGFFTFTTNGGNAETYSKVEGLHDTNPIAVAYDRTTGTCVIGYSNTNIDLFRYNNFKVLPGLKNTSFSGSKSIRDIYTVDGMAYISTGLGIVVINLAKQEVKETYVFSKGGQTMAVNAFLADDTYFYGASEAGLYRIARNSPAPQVFSNWQPVDTQRSYTRLAMVKGAIFAATSGFTDTLYRINGVNNRQRVWFSDSTSITRLDGVDSILYTGTFTKNGLGRSYHFSLNNVIVDSTFVAYPKGTVKADDGSLWVADAYQGMGKRQEDGRVSFFIPGGPNSPDNPDVYARAGEVWVAHGGIYGTFLGQKKTTGLSHLTSKGWEAFTPYNYSLFQDSVFDFITLAKDERTGTLYAGSIESGIYERKADGTGRMIKQGELEGKGGEYPVTGLAIDLNGSLWANQYGLKNELAERTADNVWHHYAVPQLGRYFASTAADIIVDDLNQKWYRAPFGGGVIVFSNDDGTPRYRNLLAGKGNGNGNLPSNGVQSLVKDRDGAIWIGTDKGIGIMGSPSQVFADPTSEVELRVVQYDQFAGLLFSNESVSAMAVDGANRKWIGTGNGVWLLSPDATKIISRFTVDNSPLPSNSIQSIAVDDVTGDVYFGTADGLISYRGTATEGAETAGDIKTFPSPIPSGYTGPITMNGFTTDADVRITDIAGQLVYRAKSAGGQLVWNGMDYTGHRPQSGVLLIFATNKDGTQTAVGKMMLIH